MATATDARSVSERVQPVRARRHPLFGGLFLASHVLALNALGLFSTAYIIRRLGAFHYGEWATAAALAAAHLVVTDIGLRSIFVREVARRPEQAGALLAEQLGLRMVLSGFAAASAMTICVLLRYPPVVLACMAVGCVWIVLSVLSTVLGDLLQSLEQFGSFAATGLVAGLGVTAVSVVAVHQGCGPIGLSIAYLTAPAINVSLYWRLASRHVRIGIRFDSTRVRALLRESRLLGLSRIAAAARDRAESLLGPRLVGLEAFGIFSAGSLVADRLGYVPDAICTAFYPRISRAVQDSVGRSPDAPSPHALSPEAPSPDAPAPDASSPETSSAEAIATSLLTIGIAACVPLAIAGMCAAPLISKILLPAASDTCRTVIQISVWAVPLLALSYGMSFSLQAAGHHEIVARMALRSTVISAAASAGLITAFGIQGASWSLLARPAIVAIALLPSFRRTFARSSRVVFPTPRTARRVQPSTYEP